MSIMPLDKVLEDRLQEKYREEIRERVLREGFETSAYDCDPGETCEKARTHKPKHRYVTEPCGEQALVDLQFRSPRNPDGLRVRLCRRHLAGLVKDLTGYLA